MPREKRLRKIGGVSIVRLERSPNLYVRWWRPGTPGTPGRWVWQSVKSPDLKVAVRQAEFLNDLARRRRGLVPLQQERRPLLLADVVELDLRTWTVGESQKRRCRDELRKFFSWLIEAHAAGEQVPLEDFSVSDLSEPLLRRYVAWLQQDRNHAYDSVRHALYPLRRAARYAEQFGIPNRIRNLTHRRETPPEIRWVRLPVLLDWLRGLDRPDLAAIAGLQGLAGLRLTEAISLRACDYDPRARTIEITDGLAKPKTLASYRVIPICQQVVDLIDAWLAIEQSPDPGAPLFSTRRRATWTRTAYGATIRKRIRAAGLELQPHDLRKCFATHVESVLNCPAGQVDLYLGQTGQRSALRARHYTARVLSSLRRDVVEPLESSLAGKKRAVVAQD